MKGVASDATKRIFTLRLRLAEEGGGLLRRGRVDEDTAPPLEPGGESEHRPYFEMPVIPVRGRLAQGRAVQVEVVGGLLQCQVQLAHRQPERVRKAAELGRIALLEDRPVLARKDEQLERGARGERAKRDVPIGLQHDARAFPRLLREHVAENTAVLLPEVRAGAGELALELRRDQRKRDELRVRMAQRGPGGCAIVLEEDGAAQTHVAREVDNAFLDCPQHLLDLLWPLLRELARVLRRLDDHLV